ncbi:Putative RNA binding protein [Komagataella phaffii CBS 7435]|uniref:RNA binding protein n=2 Tax=Komagataella phaffii TaxID=460519 RepID=C4R6A4_KOMPG|nr:uncharacterized protein PAS_chr3_1027 [Komagataella phaffii GS115]AOA63142.1 GQ67_04158T0 [Komagataella phaffii]CAH2449071.1 Putative RNA binding protein [Komagataella phaffii CBS 7435]AOA68913.1 GQ68_04131T0 [Komagataella phaffii GS115]CAY71090.1 Protein of unknown function, rich in asparagine residues [Komagataella phaffii GS115]CCA39113.1 Putative RNA binding protein [Komagataella phaffii CBS 7435]
MSDRYIVLHINTTANESSQQFKRDPSEIIELAWVLLDPGTNFEIVGRGSVLAKPFNTPITPLCTSMTTLTWESVKNAGSLKDAVEELSRFIDSNLVSNGLSFSFITLNAWDLRLKLPKESRERSIALPAYLDLPKYFDLRKEFCRWAQKSSALTTNGNHMSLAYMVSKLETEASLVLDEDLRSKVNSARRAHVDAELTAKVAATLLKSNSGLFQKPHDLQRDLEQFLNEKSKVLYMSNLSTDTTQSELESWFTQFGGRPIVFWTLTSDSGCPPSTGVSTSSGQSSISGSVSSNAANFRPTGSGFAICATHEEAVDSLTMNGRTLNDRIIEVQPSSVRVLDRAQEILSPFPSSKNRPRPGDWTCPSCGFSNFQRRTACFRCSFPVSSAIAVQDSFYPVTQTHNSRPSSGSVPFRAGDWKCANENCSYHNFAKNICCLKCGARKTQANNSYYGHNANQHHVSQVSTNMMRLQSHTPYDEDPHQAQIQPQHQHQHQPQPISFNKPSMPDSSKYQQTRRSPNYLQGFNNNTTHPVYANQNIVPAPSSLHSVSHVNSQGIPSSSLNNHAYSVNESFYGGSQANNLKLLSGSNKPAYIGIPQNNSKVDSSSFTSGSDAALSTPDLAGLSHGIKNLGFSHEVLEFEGQ